MTVKQLAEQNQGMSSFEMQKDDGIRQFERVCRKYGVDYAVRKVSGDKPKYIIFFKGRDQDAIKSAFIRERENGATRAALGALQEQ